MNQVEKMYKNAGIKPYIYCSKPQLDCNARETGNCKQDCEYYSGERLLAPFTTEKQIELIKWLIVHNPDTCLEDEIIVSAFEDSLANIINSMWHSLTEEEKQQVKGILE